MAIKPLFLVIASLLIFSFDQQKQATAPISDKTISDKDLFDSDEILSITLKGDLRELLNDRGEKPTYHPITFSYKTKDSSEINIPVQMKTRGISESSKTFLIH